ncbi:MAG TPA: hypothetical protein ENN61_00920 [Bacteroidaceae bacterium]|nr:hypothetical protein [Bacteroidaceae bacterium]
MNLITGEGHHGRHHTGIDPHVWLSPENAKIISKNILKAMLLQFPEKSDLLNENYRLFIDRIDSLDTYISQVLEGLENRSFMSYHPSLTYFARDYNLHQHPLELEGKPPSPAYLKYLADLGKKEGINVIFLQMQFDQHDAEVLAREIGAKVININPLDPEWYDQMVFITNILKAEADE